MELYNEALTLAPRYAEGYRQRALTLVRLGDRVQAQVDYNRFLAFDPQAPNQVQEEITLFEQSGRGQIGRPQAAAYSYGEPINASSPYPRPGSESSQWELADSRFSLAQDAFQRANYGLAFQWAMKSDRDMPQARTRALMAQILFAQGAFSGAADQARAAVAMGPAIDWRVLYSYYDYATPRFNRQLDSLKEFVRQNPSSADAHFLLGYQRLVLGQDGPAHAELAIAAVIQPNDVVAKDLLARDGVEIVRSYRPLARAAAPGGSFETADRWPPLPSGASPPRGGIVPPAPQAQRPSDLR
jgi:tetratricopeptide (TPR) repeat protein